MARASKHRGRLSGLLIGLAMLGVSGIALGDDPTAKPLPSAPKLPATQPSQSASNQPAAVAHQPAKKQARNSTRQVAWLELDGVLPDGPPPFRLIPTDEGPKSMRRIVRRFAELGKDRSVAGAVIYLNQPSLTMSQVEELSRAIIAFRAMGKRVIAFAEAYDLHTYMLAVNCDRVTLLENGEIGITGLSMEEMYLAGLLEKVGAKADFIQVGKFKGAEEPMTRKGPTAEWSSTIDSVLDDMYGNYIKAIGAARGRKPEDVEKFFGECWGMTNEELVKGRWIDSIVDRDMVDETENTFGTEFDYVEFIERHQNKQPGGENPFALMQMLLQPGPKAPARNSIAVINARGAIYSGRSQAAGRTGLFSEESIGSQSLEEALADARSEPLIVGVVIRLDSPGGSALASEVIWQAVRGVKEHKPVYISIDSMAASGGYYIACAGERIYVLPSTIVGSIGVVAGKVTLGGLYEKVGLNVYRRNRGPVADMFNSVTGFTPEQAQMLKKAMTRTYDLFVSRVTEGRGKKVADVDKIAQGRLFSGTQAVANGMADKIGGLSVAVDDLARELKLSPGSYDVIEWPPPMNLMEYLDNYLQSMASSGVGPLDQARNNMPAALARQVLGPRAWRSVGPVASGLMMLSAEHVLTLMPVAIVVK